MTTVIEPINVTEIIPNSRFATMAPISAIKPSKGETKDQNWDFDVDQVDLLTPDGIKSGIKGVRRLDTGAIIGQYKRQSLLENKVLIYRFEEALNRLGIKFTRTIRTFSNGSRMEAKYKFPEMTQKIAGENHTACITVRNSYDGTWKISGYSLVERLICLNGVVSMAKAFALAQRHGKDIDLETCIAKLEAAIENGNAEGILLENLATKEVNTGQVENILGNISAQSSGHFSTKTATRVLMAWHQPSDDERPLGNNLYRLMQAGTRTLRDLTNAGRAEMASKANWQFGQRLTLAGNPQISNYARHAFAELTAEPKPEFSLFKLN